MELADKLGIPSAVWSSGKKLWLDHRGHEIRVRGPEDIARCPSQIAIVSTGLIFHDSEERRHLLERRYGTVILDEAHRARRRGGLGKREKDPNNLLDFMLRIGRRTRHLLLGTATPIQTEVRELWDLLRVLNAGAEFVLGREMFGGWADIERALPLVKGETPVRSVHAPAAGGAGCIRDSVRAGCRSGQRPLGALFACACASGYCREDVHAVANVESRER